LFQLPPNLSVDADQLAAFLNLLKRRRRYVFEFRHSSWYEPHILSLLSAQNIALCISDHHDAPAPWKRAADFVHVRGHGPGGRYSGCYKPAQLSEWAKHIRGWNRRGCDVYVYFDDDQKSAAPADAKRRCKLLETKTLPPHGHYFCRATISSESASSMAKEPEWTLEPPHPEIRLQGPGDVSSASAHCPVLIPTALAAECLRTASITGSHAHLLSLRDGGLQRLLEAVPPYEPIRDGRI
jgi:hypothetical protein